jgi:hypothetical protein
MQWKGIIARFALVLPQLMVGVYLTILHLREKRKKERHALDESYKWLNTSQIKPKIQIFFFSASCIRESGYINAFKRAFSLNFRFDYDYHSIRQWYGVCIETIDIVLY